MLLDSDRVTQFNVNKNPHIDYGYVLTSHSSQGQTTDRVLIQIDTSQAGEKLVNQRLAYVAVSRGRYNAQIYTNNALELRDALSRNVSKTVALEIDAQFNHGGRSQFLANKPLMSSAPARVTQVRGHPTVQSRGVSEGRQVLLSVQGPRQSRSICRAFQG